MMRNYCRHERLASFQSTIALIEVALEYNSIHDFEKGLEISPSNFG